MYYPRFLLHWISKTVVLVVFLAYLSLAIWTVSRAKSDARLHEKLTPTSSHLSEFNRLKVTHFDDVGQVLIFGVATSKKRSVNYLQPDTRASLRRLQQRVESTLADVSPNVTVVSWLTSFDEYVKSEKTMRGDGRQNIDTLLMTFLSQNDKFRDDVTFASDNVTVVACRFFVFVRSKTPLETNNILSRSRAVVNNFSSSAHDSSDATHAQDVRAFVYTKDFTDWEHYTSIAKTSLLVVGVTMVGLLFVALVFVPHPVAITCVTSSMLSVELGMVASMTLLGLELSVLTLVPLVLSVTLCTDATVRMSHAFMTVTGKTRNERVAVALQKVCVATLNSAVTLIFATSPLAFATSFELRCFFKLLSIAILLVLLHSLLIIPVILSFIGPRRTSRPRVFIPVSNSARSLQDTYRANSITRPTSEDIYKFRQQRLQQLQRISAQVHADDDVDDDDVIEMTSHDTQLTRSQSADDVPTTARTTMTSLTGSDARTGGGACSRRVSFAVASDDVTTSSRRSSKRPSRQLTRTQEVDVDDVTMTCEKCQRTVCECDRDVTSETPIKFYFGRSVSRE